ncbi:hypothetical protein T492DRAFT_834558 [Pavlovales sp. CCMP2436]|nr:hypothetical protein T492DRAFT_834558 [Pavlovales sp. CCMP2436]
MSAFIITVILFITPREILYSSVPKPYDLRVIVLAHFNNPSWPQVCAPLISSLKNAQVDYIIGFLNLTTFSGLAMRNAECMLDKSPGGCAQVFSHGDFFAMDKAHWTRDVVTSGLLHPDALVIATDCTDTHLMCGAAELECKFEAIAKEPGTVIHAVEYNLWPYDATWKAIKRGTIPNPYPPSPSGMRYGNGGQLLGRAKDIGAFFNRMRREWENETLAATGVETWCCPTGEKYVLAPQSKSTDCYNDQRCLHTYVAAGFHNDGRGPSLKFDYLAELFLTLGRVSNRVTIGRASFRDLARVAFNLSQALAPTTGKNRLQVWAAKKAYTSPCWIHGAGAGKARFFKISKQLDVLVHTAVGPPLPDPVDTELQQCCRRLASRDNHGHVS